MADNTEKPKAQTAKDIPWCKSLKSLPVFTRKEIDEHRNNSGKRKADDVSKPIKKTLKRGLKFQEERYLSSDTVYTKVFGNSFMVKAKCRASMSTREIHELEVSLDVTSGNVRGHTVLAELAKVDTVLQKWKQHVQTCQGNGVFQVKYKLISISCKYLPVLLGSSRK